MSLFYWDALTPELKMQFFPLTRKVYNWVPEEKSLL